MRSVQRSTGRGDRVSSSKPRSCTAFLGKERVASGDIEEVTRRSKESLDSGDDRSLLIFDDASARPVEIDFRGSMQNVLGRVRTRFGEEGTSREGPDHAKDAGPRSPGRPKLGVVGREVTLLPRHWEWLNEQPGGASVTLRKLVEQARRDSAGKDRVRRSQEAAHRFMTAMAGDEPGYEEAARALFSGSRERFEASSRGWPGDVRDYALSLAADALDPQATSGSASQS